MKNFKELLRKPSRESQPWAMWIWNLAITRSQLMEQFNWFIENGFGGIAVRPSRDMVPTYLSEEFIDLFALVLRNAQKQGIGIRIADDFSLPWSGCFSGETAQSPQMRAQHLRLLEDRLLSSREEVFIKEFDPHTEIAMTIRYHNGLIDPASVHELTGSGGPSSGKWLTPEGEWRLLVFRKEFVVDPSNGFIPNVFNPKVASVYIQRVLDVFKSNFYKYMPATFEGFISELPSCRPGNATIPWEDDLVVKFRSKSKKNLIKLLPALFCDCYPAAQKNRQQIYTFIHEFMFERFVAPLEAWAKKNRFSQWVLAPERSVYSSTAVLADGAVPPETDLNAVGYQNIDGVAENYALLRVMADANANEFRRETVSVMGRNRSGIGATVQSLKSDFDSLLLSGPSKVIIDGCYFNLDQRSYAKTPFNPGWYSPGNGYVGELCTYITRCQEIMKNIHWNRQVAVFVPTSEIMAAYLPSEGNASAVGLERLDKTIRALDRCGISYDLVSENLVSNCAVRSNGEFGTADRIRKGNYQALIIPYAPDISRNVLIFIEKLVHKEGCVFFIENAPCGTIEDGVSPTMSGRIEKILADRHKRTGIIKLAALDDAFKSITPHVRILANGRTGSDIYHAFGSGEGYELYLFHNISETKEYAATIELAENRHYTLIDCENGELSEVPFIENVNGYRRFQFNAYPKTTSIVAASSAPLVHGSREAVKAGRCNPFVISERGYRIVLKDQWVFSTSSLNALPLANWNLRIGLSRESGTFSHFYESHFQVKSLPSVCKLILTTPGMRRFAAGATGAPPMPMEITINGSRADSTPETVEQPPSSGEERAEPSVQGRVFDESIPLHFSESAIAFSIGEHLVRGFNRISIRTTGQVLDPDTIHYPPLLFGDFALVKGQNGWAIDRQGEVIGGNSWITHGFPYLCGKGVYSQSFEVPNEYKRLVMRFSQVSGTIDITLNNKNLGVFNWQPIEVDITSVCESKRNELVIGVVNSIDTILKMNGRPSGLIGEVYLDVY
ncbi:MAG: hypothetical protein JXA18_16675 [Chitinispirillaceae bacterium]|nr:hypothetical protein [Chitinispirillaceae bacterium]